MHVLGMNDNLWDKVRFTIKEFFIDPHLFQCLLHLIFWKELKIYPMGTSVRKGPNRDLQTLV